MCKGSKTKPGGEAQRCGDCEGTGVIYEGSKTLPPCEDQTLHILNHKIYLIGREYINNMFSL